MTKVKIILTAQSVPEKELLEFIREHSLEGWSIVGMEALGVKDIPAVIEALFKGGGDTVLVAHSPYLVQWFNVFLMASKLLENNLEKVKELEEKYGVSFTGISVPEFEVFVYEPTSYGFKKLVVSDGDWRIPYSSYFDELRRLHSLTVRLEEELGFV